MAAVLWVTECVTTDTIINGSEPRLTSAESILSATPADSRIVRSLDLPVDIDEYSEHAENGGVNAYMMTHIARHEAAARSPPVWKSVPHGEKARLARYERNASWIATVISAAQDEDVRHDLQGRVLESAQPAENNISIRRRIRDNADNSHATINAIGGVEIAGPLLRRRSEYATSSAATVNAMGEPILFTIAAVDAHVGEAAAAHGENAITAPPMPGDRLKTVVREAQPSVASSLSSVPHSFAVAAGGVVSGGGAASNNLRTISESAFRRGGPLNGAGDVINVIVSRRDDEDTAWLHDLGNLSFTLETEDELSDGHLPLRQHEEEKPLSYIGSTTFECGGYLAFISKHYDALPNVSVFVHGNPYGSSQHPHGDPHVISLIHRIARSPNSVGYCSLNRASTWDGPTQAFGDVFADPARYSEVFKVISRLISVSSRMACFDSGQFAVSRERIHAHPRAFYEQLLTYLINSRDRQQAFLRCIDLENTWHVIFGEPLTCSTGKNLCSNVYESDNLSGNS